MAHLWGANPTDLLTDDFGTIFLTDDLPSGAVDQTVSPVLFADSETVFTPVVGVVGGITFRYVAYTI